MSEQPQPRLACAREREELIQCVIRTDCVLKKGKTPADCIKQSKDELPLLCQHLLLSYADCKKGMLDMRRRFRGNHLSEEAKRETSGKPDSALGA
ncbi:uncharacterized protein EHS24_005126 [Apiotrichum porosum]|uniref:Cytochrome c oxidase assembly factor 5 n=1 Tax=Apiotrichum porosum TaxID=105984 RepID=A0A427Y6Y7_9TREE|nr:uncharacterized protein EHS24_005126 [Apiotrichum porosum]RSH86848.1 hypothetical protein EHS24_005126 [Apiotrichum porosum]